jgi:hypothetical protein
MRPEDFFAALMSMMMSMQQPHATLPHPSLTSCEPPPHRVSHPLSRNAWREHIRAQGIEFCRRYPDDFVCPRK